MSNEGIKIICDNRRIKRNYIVEETYEAGIVLLGSEVKSLRSGRANLQDSYADFINGELFLINSHISPYEMANRLNHEPTRKRKLLMHDSELKRLWGKSEIRGYTLVPVKLYFKKGIVKVELGLCRGKKQFDKREAIKKREEKRLTDRVMKKRKY